LASYLPYYDYDPGHLNLTAELVSVPGRGVYREGEGLLISLMEVNTWDGYLEMSW
jgi:hypothetical protein